MSPWQATVRRALLLGVVAALGLGLLGFVSGREVALRGLLAAWLVTLAIPTGSFVLLLIHALTGGTWGQRLRPALAPAAASLPLVALVFLPIAFNLGALYPWAARPETVPPDVARLYLAPDLFLLRAVVILALWSVLAVLASWLPRLGPLTAGLGLLAYGVSVGVAAVDWAMSLDPRWTSTAYGAFLAVSQITAALAWACLTPARRSEVASAGDAGGLLLAAVLGLAYLGFMQYLVIWSGNQPPKIGWYVARSASLSQVVGPLSILLGFVVPTAMLAVDGWRKGGRPLTVAAGFVLAGLFLQWVWQVTPGLDLAGLAAALLAFLALGGLWLGITQGGLARLVAPADLRTDASS